MIYSAKDYKKIGNTAGVYIYRDNGKNIIYIGKAKDLKKRVSSYFTNDNSDNPKTNILVQKTSTIETIPVLSEFEALLLEAKLIKLYKPKYNIIWKDDKHYIYINITDEEFPRVLLSRLKNIRGESVIFGPFPSTHTVREVLDNIRHIFPYCNSDRKTGRSCFYTHIGLCQPCPAYIKTLPAAEYGMKKREYLSHIKSIKMLLSGKLKRIHRELVSSMRKLSAEENFEKAAVLKDRIEHFEYLTQRYHSPDSFIADPYLFQNVKAKESVELKKILSQYIRLNKDISKIECYDISNLAGKFATGSLVTFVNGLPDKNQYRHFRIRLKKTPDDFAMLEEIMKRRLLHKEWSFPDLFVIDGGKPQLSKIIKVFEQFKIGLPVIGLAKEFEEIVVPVNGNFKKIKLPDHSYALNLIKRVRDEAHRFAHRYHEVLRLKNLIPEN